MLGTGVLGWTMAETEATEIVHIENAARAKAMFSVDPSKALNPLVLLEREAEPEQKPEDIVAGFKALARQRQAKKSKPEKR